MQYGYFDDQAQEYVITRLELYKRNVKNSETRLHIKRQNMKCTADSGDFSWLKVGNLTL
jgi:hypothetical protein